MKSQRYNRDFENLKLHTPYYLPDGSFYIVNKKQIGNLDPFENYYENINDIGLCAYVFYKDSILLFSYLRRCTDPNSFKADNYHLYMFTENYNKITDKTFFSPDYRFKSIEQAINNQVHRHNYYKVLI